MTAGVGGSTKKLAFGASYQLGYTVGNIIGPQTYRESDGPDYYVRSITSSPKYQTLIFSLLDRQVHHASILADESDLPGIYWLNSRVLEQAKR